MLLPQILHQASVGKAQLPQHSLTLTHICPASLTAPRHRAPALLPPPPAWLWPGQSLAPGQPVPVAPAPNCTGALAHPASWERPSARCHTDPTASFWAQHPLTCLLCPQGVQGQHRNAPRGSANAPPPHHVPNSPALLRGAEGKEPGTDAETLRDPGWAWHGAPATPLGTGTLWDAGPLHPGLCQKNWEPQPCQKVAPGGARMALAPEELTLPEVGMGWRWLRVPGRAGCCDPTWGSQLCLLGWDSP